MCRPHVLSKEDIEFMCDRPYAYALRAWALALLFPASSCTPRGAIAGEKTKLAASSRHTQTSHESLRDTTGHEDARATFDALHRTPTAVARIANRGRRGATACCRFRSMRQQRRAYRSIWRRERRARGRLRVIGRAEPPANCRRTTPSDKLASMYGTRCSPSISLIDERVVDVGGYHSDRRHL